MNRGYCGFSEGYILEGMFQKWERYVSRASVIVFRGEKDTRHRVKFNRPRPHTENIGREKAQCDNTVPLRQSVTQI